MRETRDDDDGSVTGTKRSRLSMAQVLPLVTLSVVVIVLGTAMGVVWYALTHSAVSMVEEHLGRAVNQLATTTAAGLRGVQARYALVARDPAIGREFENVEQAELERPPASLEAERSADRAAAP